MTEFNTIIFYSQITRTNLKAVLENSTKLDEFEFAAQYNIINYYNFAQKEMDTNLSSRNGYRVCHERN
jgi:hypothetical protein